MTISNKWGVIMTDIEQAIYRVISEANGIRVQAIAAALGLSTNLVYTYLEDCIELKSMVYQDSSYNWFPKSHSINIDVDTHTPDPDLRKLCLYYLNCLSFESSNYVSQFVGSFDNETKYVLLKGITEENLKEKNAISFLMKIKENRDVMAYFGYPVRVYTVQSKYNKTYKKVAPILLYPIDYSGGKISIADTPIINMEVLRAFSDGEKESLASELIALEKELGMDSADFDVGLEEIVLRLVRIRQWDWKETIDPFHILSTESLSNLDEGIYNKPIVIEAENTKFTQGLETELSALARMPEDEFRNTALYAWVKNAVPHEEKQEKTLPLLEVLPLNLEQTDAVQTALSSNLTIVTGPPGTGKSQVVTDLLINLIWNGKTALFSSKNHKAVDIVEQRINGLCKRPALMRLGYDRSKISEIINGLLNVRTSKTQKDELKLYYDEYQRICKEGVLLQEKKTNLINARNQVDELEKQYCAVRDLIGPCFDLVCEEDCGKIKTAFISLQKSSFLANKKNNRFFERLFWKHYGNIRVAERDKWLKEYNSYAVKYQLETAKEQMTDGESELLFSQVVEFEKALLVACKYKKAFQALKGLEPLEDLDRDLLQNKKQLSSVAKNLWDRWFNEKSMHLTPRDRAELSSFAAAIELGVDNIGNNPFVELLFKDSSRILKSLPCWAVTSLSAKRSIPFVAGFFDYVIIDEASQCDIASILPLLFRSKRVVIIGDPKQLRHIPSLTVSHDNSLIHKYNIEKYWSASVRSVYDLASVIVPPDQIIHLRDHFRSCSEIIEFSNKHFYDGSLRAATDYAKLKIPADEKAGIRWVNVVGKSIRPETGSLFNIEEANAVISELKRLVIKGYTGSIGVVTPFREQKERIRTLIQKKTPDLYEKLVKEHEFIIDTVHGFQGDERDLMLFSTVVSDGTPSSALGFLNETSNLFNVAVTRARGVLVIIGNYRYCKECVVDYLKAFAEYYRHLVLDKEKEPDNILISKGREYPWVENPENVSEWERLFYTALYDAGVDTIPQYPVDKYKLDLAIVKNRKKLDIEIDGELYHRSWNGELCYRDQLRNQRLFELGWDVKRFWVYQIRDELEKCIDEIQNWCISAS